MRFRLVVAFAIAVACLSQMGLAQFIEKENLLPRHFPTKQRFAVEIVTPAGQNLVYHNGPVIPTAFVVPIFWGPSWTGSNSSMATSLTNYIDGNGGADLGYGET